MDSDTKASKVRDVRCTARLKTGKQCKKMSVAGYSFCRVHCFGRMSNVPWYHNVILHSVAGILATVCFGWIYFHKGPSPEKQDELLAKQGTSIAKQDEGLEILRSMKANTKEKDADLKKEFNLGYRLFGIANNEFFPFQGPPEQGILVHWERNQQKYECNGPTITLHLPDIDLRPNMMLHGVTLQLLNEVGSRLSFHLDTVFYKHGAAIVSNTWVKSGVRTNTSPRGAPFPHETRITQLTQATINWDTASTYALGQLKMRGNELWIDGGTLTAGQSDIFENVELVRGNVFNGSPRGGYKFPKAGAILGNEFRDGMIDARSLRDGVIVANNRFVSSAGAFTIGPQPEVSFVIGIVQTQTDGAVLLFGLKPYLE